MLVSEECAERSVWVVVSEVRMSGSACAWPTPRVHSKIEQVKTQAKAQRGETCLERRRQGEGRRAGGGGVGAREEARAGGRDKMTARDIMALQAASEEGWKDARKRRSRSDVRSPLSARQSQNQVFLSARMCQLFKLKNKRCSEGLFDAVCANVGD